jgi:hypothetical protein
VSGNPITIYLILLLQITLVLISVITEIVRIYQWRVARTRFREMLHEIGATRFATGPPGRPKIYANPSSEGTHLLLRWTVHISHAFMQFLDYITVYSKKTSVALR